VTIAEAKTILMRVCDEDVASSVSIRQAITALPDRTYLDQLDPLYRALIETRLYQLVTLGVVS
jgi:hypothetical protein